MAELRLESSDGEYLVLESPDGTTYRLLIDEALRKAVRRETVTADDSNRISPRDIQLEVRSGVTIEELAAKTGASLEYIQKFAAPVIDELAHVVKSALSVRITMAGDRYNETTQVEFGEVIANRLAATGVVQQTWTARKSDNNGWQLHCHYGDNHATWAFDPRKLALAPENELAVQLSTQQSLTDGPIPRLRPVISVTGATQQDAATEFEPTFAEPLPPISLVPNSDLSVGEESPDEPAAPTEPERAPATVTSLTRDLAETVALEEDVPFGRQAPLAEAAEEFASSTDIGTDLANTADLLDALRRRRIERERDSYPVDESLAADTPVEIEPVTIAVDPQPVEKIEAELEAEPAEDYLDFAQFDGVDEPAAETAPIETIGQVGIDSAEGPELEAEKPKKAGRSSMPSWDEIVFNTRHDD